MSRRRVRGREQQRRCRTRREQANREPALEDPTPEWMDVGGRRMFVVGFTSGGAPYGCYDDEFDEDLMIMDAVDDPPTPTDGPSSCPPMTK